MKKAFQENLKKLALATLDTDKDGKVSKEELLVYMNHPSFPEDTKEECTSVLFANGNFVPQDQEGDLAMLIFGGFIYADKDKDKRISLAEATAFLGELYHACELQPLTAEEIAGTFGESDSNHDGFLDFEDFCDFYDIKETLLD